MLKIKMCPTCGMRNDIYDQSCRTCGRLLEQPAAMSLSAKKFRTCPICDMENDISALSCKRCETPLENRIPHFKETSETSLPNEISRPLKLEYRSLPAHIKSSQKKHIMIGVLCIFIIGLACLSFIFFRTNNASPDSSLLLPQGIGTIISRNGENIGVNDGSYPPFDAGRATQEELLKQQAAQQLRAGNSQAAISLWQQALGVESNDAEALIYIENQHVLASGNAYITLIVGVAFTPPFPDVASESVLQGVYVAQHEYNASHFAGIQLRILIANSGSNVTDTTAIAQQIVRIAHRDQTAIGVVGWLHSANSLTAISVLAQAKIPMISSQSTSDELSGISPYFFRVVSPNEVEAQVATQFAVNTLHVTRPVIFLDSSDVYSQNLAQDFRDQFAQSGHSILKEEIFTTDKTRTGQFSALIQDAEKYHPDVFIFTSASNADAANFQDALPIIASSRVTIPVIAGSGSYTAHPNSYGRWYFTASAFHGANNTSIAQKFAQEYSADFNSHNQHPAGYYSYTLADDHAILSYDATSVFILAIHTSYASGKTALPPQHLAQILPQIAFQGVSGQIIFGPNHDPVNKAVFILFISSQGHIQLQQT